MPFLYYDTTIMLYPVIFHYTQYKSAVLLQIKKKYTSFEFCRQTNASPVPPFANTPPPNESQLYRWLTQNISIRSRAHGQCMDQLKLVCKLWLQETCLTKVISDVVTTRKAIPISHLLQLLSQARQKKFL